MVDDSFVISDEFSTEWCGSDRTKNDFVIFKILEKQKSAQKTVSVKAFMLPLMLQFVPLDFW